ncbi:phosphopantetheine-binding protein [Bacillus sp. FSL M8-0077]|uniref:phosphopantetheine-binding protein n=1 Tax=Bacillus sp. FSL M8-0077 TaxID=2954556 RepID=UPI001154CB6C
MNETTDALSLSSQVKDLVLRSLDDDSKISIGADEELTNQGLDSIKAVSLILELEEVFDIQFADEELLTEHFSTINKIVHQLQNKLAD